MEKSHVALLTGGKNSEREVALRSAENVRKALEENFTVEVFDLPRDLDRFLASRSGFDIAVPVFHGRWGEDGVIQGLLEVLGVPYIFSNVEAHAVGMNKVMCKELARSRGLKTAEWKVLECGDSMEWTHPVVAKPVDEGSSVGVSLIRDAKSFAQIFPATRRLLVEDLIEGQEFTVAVVEHEGGAVALPVIEIRSKKEFFDFESKYDPALCDELCPAPIHDGLAKRLKDVALTAHKMIGARHLSRTDMIVDHDGTIWFLEINTIPGLTSASLTPKAIAAAGLRLEDLLKAWVDEVMKKTA
ncbi:D-alanine--D-alanine ligase [Candidatus Uhrbacteria bacterium]|nr:D-alanine--D-alanine ligase [Candidatus Uhrbacteria bacterium]